MRRPGARVTFPDGTVVFGLHIDARVAADAPPDFGLYLDAMWQPTWPATVVDWEDFAAPDDEDVLFAQVRSAFDRARSGAWVEVGCLAGCGRTGTVLACMAVLSGVPVSDAVTWVRRNYDSCAVETASQEALIKRFATTLER
jgi:Protein-tyrosine phosphatase